MDLETIEHIGLGAAGIVSLILVARYLIIGISRTTKVYEAVEGDGVEPSLHEWRNEVRELLHRNVDDHLTIGRRLDDIQSELAHNGGMSVKDAVHRTERKLDDHLAAADLRQEAIVDHMRQIRQQLEAQGLQLPPLPTEYT